MRSRFSNPRAWVGGTGIRAAGASPAPYPTSSRSMSRPGPFDETILNMVPSQNDMQYRYWESLRSQSLYPPAGRLARVDEAVMHPAIPALPELDHLGAQQVATPVLRPARGRFTEVEGELRVSPVELLPFDRPALGRDRGRDLAVAWPTREVGVGFLRRKALHRSADSHLSIELAPVENQGGACVRRELTPLRALVVAEETKAVRAEALEQDHPGVRGAFRIDRGQSHRLRQRHNGPGLIEPLGELLERLVRQVLTVKRRAVRATRAHSESRADKAERMPGVPVGASLRARIAMKGESGQ